MGQLCLNPDCRETQRNYWVLSKKYEELKAKVFSDSSWKGEDIISIAKNEERGVWVIISHQKDKESGKVKEISHEVSHENILIMRTCLYLVFIEQHTNELNRKLTRDLKLKVMKKHGLEYTPQEFFGRRKEYFEKYYYCLKVLEHFNLIEYMSSGVIRLKDYFFEDKNFK